MNKDLQDLVPATIREAVEVLEASLTAEDREFIKASSPGSVHFGGGMSMRNNWSLWERETPMKRDAVENYRIAHADDLSGLIFAWLWSRVRGEGFDPVAYCQRFHDHWAERRMTSLQAGNYNEDGTPRLG